MTAQTSFGQWLKQRRKALDITREDLAQQIGFAISTLYKIEADQRRPSKQIAALLAEHLNVPPEERPAFVRFARAEEVEDAAPWGTPFHPPTNLTTQSTLLIGRDEDVAAIRKRLLRNEARLLTLIGPPGIGKTWLALAVADELLDDFADGVFFVALAPISDASLVLPTIATPLGIPDAGPQTTLERLKVFLRDKQMLVVLDNFEQILSAAPQIADLLAACPLLKILVTSRAPLRIRNERQIPVAPLSVPDLAHLPDVESLPRYSAVTLFLERAQTVKPDFALTQENAPTVAALCARLDGLPLAIELISARIKLLSPAALLERLGGCLMLQSDGMRDLEPRHRTLNAAIDWSYQLLSAEEQTLFPRLSVFVGGWTLDAAEAVCMENLSLSILDSTASLLDKNLVKQATSSDGEPRFMMLETIREYALEQVIARGELATLRRQHAAYFTTFAESLVPALRHPDFGYRLNSLEAEHDNFRAALAETDTALRLALALGEFWSRRGHLSEGRGWFASVLERPVDVLSGELSETDHMLRAQAYDWIGIFAQWQGDLDAAQPYFKESLKLFQGLGDINGVAGVLGNFGMFFQMQGNYERAATLLEESLALRRELGTPGGIAFSLFFLGTLAYTCGETQRAQALLEESLIGMRLNDDIWGLADVLVYLAMVAVEQGDYSRANLYLTESLTKLREQGERWQIVQTLEVFACLATTGGQPAEIAPLSHFRAARIFGGAEVLREILHAPVLPSHRQFYQRGIANLRTQLDEAAFAVAWAEGREMALDQIVAYALNQTD